MKDTKNRIKVITVLAFLIALLSVGIGYSSYNTTIEVSGKAIAIENVYDIRLDNINSVNTSLNTTVFKEEPRIIGNSINFAITSLTPNNSVTFKFDLYNESLIPTKIKNITLKGIEKYNDNLVYNISNLNIGDIIKGESKILDNTFTLSYKEAYKDEFGNPLNLNLENLSLIIEFEEVKE